MASRYTAAYTFQIPQNIPHDQLQAWMRILEILRTINLEYLDHSARHENGGADEISVEGLSGLLADKQTALQHGLSDTEFHSGTSGATEDNVMTFDANGLPQDSGYTIGTVTTAQSQWPYVLGLIGVGGI